MRPSTRQEFVVPSGVVHDLLSGVEVTVKLVIGDPPFESGTDQLTEAAES